MNANEETKDPRHHVENIERKLGDLARHMGEDLRRIDEPQAKALLEAAREVIEGLRAAFEQYRSGELTAWDDSRAPPASQH